MAAKKIGKAGDAARQLAGSEHLRRLIDDAELRDSVRSAYSSGRVAFQRLQNGKGPTKALLEDKKLHKDLRATAEALRNVGESLRPPSPPRKRRRRGGLLLVLMVGGIAALALSEGLRSKLLDTIFGAEEEYDYSSNAASSPTPEPVSAS